MSIEDIRTKTDDQLKDQLTELRREALNLRFQKASGQLEGTARIKTVRREIARIQTVIGERARGATTEAAKS